MERRYSFEFCHMITTYTKTAWRNLKANRFYSLINIGGLAIGLATAIMLLLWVKDERSYDKFHQNYRQIYQISARLRSGDQQMTWHGVPGPLSVYAKAIPAVASMVRIKEEHDQVVGNGDRSKLIDNNETAFVDSTFFSIFDFKLLAGERTLLFPNSNSVVITRSLAYKFFNTSQAVGKVIDFQRNKYVITGVLKDFPENSSLKFDALFPMSVYGRQFTESGGNGDWKTIDTDVGDFSFTTFVKLRKGASVEGVERGLTAAYQKAHDTEMKTSFQLENLGDIHLIAADGNRSGLQMVNIFFLVGLLLLAIAAINYVNLSTARALVRIREVSIRKITGATRLQLFLQFICETFLLFCIATVIAFILIVLLMPLYNMVSGKTLRFSLKDAQLWKVIGLSVLGTLMAASIYPAVVLSSFRPLRALKGKPASAVGSALFRKILVVFQFSISVVLIISTLVIGRQMHYVRTKSLGYDKSYVFIVPLSGQVVNHVEAVKNALTKYPSVESAALSNFYDLSNYGNSTSDIVWPGKLPNSNLVIAQAVADKDFIPTMKMQFLEGSNFTGTAADSSYFIVNEVAVKEMGLKPPYVGQTLEFHSQKGTILGVLKDFNFKSLKEKITPLLLSSGSYKGSILFVRAEAGKLPEAISRTRREYQKYAGDIPFSYHFLDEQLEAGYKSDARAGVLFNLFAAIAIFISCLGLLGLATYTAEIRTREIGVRKVLGASIPSIIRLLGRDFIILVFLAIVVAIPVALYGMHKWLEDFAYKIHIHWWICVVAGLLSTTIAFLTVAIQGWRAARVNPVRSLRAE